MIKHPQLYNATPYNYEPDQKKPTQKLPFRSTLIETVAEDYYETCSQSKVITFDSGQHSKRRSYIESTLTYLLQVKGIPTVVLSAHNHQFTQYYLTKVPTLLRSKVLDLGLFHVYNTVVSKVRQILSVLFYDVRYRATIDYFVYSLKTLESKLIKTLNKMGILVILDRSLISTYIYNNSILDSANMNNQHLNRTNVLNIESLRSFKPYASFFVHSENPPTPTSGLKVATRKGNLYDSFDYLNYSIKGLIPQVKKQLPFMVQLPQYQTFQNNMKTIRETLKQL